MSIVACDSAMHRVPHWLLPGNVCTKVAGVEPTESCWMTTHDDVKRCPHERIVPSRSWIVT